MNIKNDIILKNNDFFEYISLVNTNLNSNSANQIRREFD